MKSTKNYQRLGSLIFGCILILHVLVFAQQDVIKLVLKPEEITAPFISGIGGTELVTIEVKNKSTQPIEMLEKRWLVIERQDNPGTPCFTPMAPYSPLIIEPGGKVTVIWRLRQPTDVQLASGTECAKVAPGEHNIYVYYKFPGEAPWRKQVIKIELKKISWVFILLGAIVFIVLLIILLKGKVA